MKRIFLVFFLFTSFFSFSDTILTTTNATYTITNLLTENTGIKVASVFETATSMESNQDIYFKRKEYSLNRYKDIVAVVDIKNVWDKDLLYKYARKENIRTIEIDLSQEYTDNSSLFLTVFKNNPYIWLDFSNVKKMLYILHNDLVRIYPDKKKILDKNLHKSLNLIVDLENRYLDIIDIDGVVILHKSIMYLASYLNIPYVYVDNYDKLKKTLKDTNYRYVLTNRHEGKKLNKIVNDCGAKLAFIKTAKLPVENEDDEDLMDKDGLIKIYEYNLGELLKIQGGTTKWKKYFFAYL